MKGTALNRLGLSNTWQMKPAGMIEAYPVLGLIDQPLLVIDTLNDSIVGANGHFLFLTSYTQSEVIGNDVGKFILGWTHQDKKPSEGFSADISLNQRNSIPAFIQPFNLYSSNRIVGLAVLPVENNPEDEGFLSIHSSVFKALPQLISLGSLPDLDSSLAQALELSKTVLNASLICIYKADSDFPQLRKLVSTETGDKFYFPEKISPTDFIRLSEPEVWIPGKRVTSDLHRAARVSNLNFLATAPLGQPGAWFGLLVAGDFQTHPSEMITNELEIIGVSLTSAIQYHLVRSQTNQVIQANNRQINIQTNITEYSREGIIILDPGLTITEMNPSAEEILGYAKREVIGVPVENILIGTESLASTFTLAAQGIPTRNLGNLRLHRRNGQPFPALIQVVPVVTENELVCIVVFLSDISENEQIRLHTQQLEQRAVLGEVTAIFAHEVRNPINNISTSLQLMAMNLPSDDVNQDLITRMQADCGRLIHLMESVLTFSKPMEYYLNPIDLDEFIPRLLDRWRPRFTGANISSTYNTSQPSLKINGDQRALEQVFTNLISNAVHAMRETGGTLGVRVNKISAGNNLPQIEISVFDSGPGIPEDVRDHIFEPFVTTSSQGTGLGLAITKRIINAHKGNIKVNSFPGGTFFQILMPAA